MKHIQTNQQTTTSKHKKHNEHKQTQTRNRLYVNINTKDVVSIYLYKTTTTHDTHTSPSKAITMQHTNTMDISKEHANTKKRYITKHNYTIHETCTKTATTKHINKNEHEQHVQV